MGKALRSRPRGHAHEQHLVLLQQCPCCARWIVLRGWANHVAAFNDQGAARAAAKRVFRDIAGRPDPAPLLVEVPGPDHVVATGLSPVVPIESLPAA